MKKLSIIAVLFALTICAQGQFKFGVSGGMNLSYVDPQTIEVGGYNLETVNENYTGFHIGAVSQISIMGMFIQPELLYTSIGNKMKIDGVGYDRKINRFDIPVMMGVSVGPIRIGAGPVGTVMLSESSELDEFITDYESKEEYNDMTFGLQFGAGFDISNFLIDVKYEYGLSKLGDGIEIAGEKEKFDSRPKQIIISLGIILN